MPGAPPAGPPKSSQAPQTGLPSDLPLPHPSYSPVLIFPASLVGSRRATGGYSGATLQYSFVGRCAPVPLPPPR